MKTKYLLLMIFTFSIITIRAQIKTIQYKPFIQGLELKDASGPGIKNNSGDILLELVSKEQDENETLLILRNSKGKLTKITENKLLLMSKDILGASSGNYPSLDGEIISVDYTLGSNSSQSDISISFQKDKDGNYWFKEYTTITRNFGVENLFERAKITAEQTGKINFSEASENLILKKAKIQIPNQTNEDQVFKASSTYSKYIPVGWRLGAYANGDLNLDAHKNDLILLLYNENECKIQLLLQQSNGSYKTEVTNDKLIVPDENFNVNNFKIVIKNGFFTLEQRIAVNDQNFDQRYVTFKYDKNNWTLYRFDVEHFSGFNPKPAALVNHLTQKDFGPVLFQNMKHFPKY
ncbi:hypothetical protein Q73A0000_02045 [Kaistella flava (ex Peng et al. 2021)]|uniref:Uncharacterized protein n=1 Tax=Kaistella flava (ex Peng et al. 2021) TaxID=2038776 RepID=A0A7M2Y724_9FLAO|nr:hypothetical protein [Kaistella flava (ex Peng et al. 2021)]QOW09222.1 hypothetical protein Q73A0000_02045 [Kaistella flava (ex Peng et al. 2021)]